MKDIVPHRPRGRAYERGDDAKPDRTAPVPLNLPGRRDPTWLTRRLGSSLLLSEADRFMLDSMRPRCAKCGKPVETFSWTNAGNAVLFTAKCHGEVEETRVSFDAFPVLMAAGVHGGEAFAAPKQIGDET